MNKIIIYSPFVNNKLAYILDFIFGDILDLNYELNPPDSNSPIVINYGNIGKKEGLIIKNDDYLREDKIFDFDEKLPDTIKNEGQHIPFDLFSAIFYMVSRAEEYNNTDPDEHGRFKATNSILFRQDLLKVAIVDRWIADLKGILEARFSIIINYKRKYEFQSTIDIDQFFAFKHKPFFIQLGSLFRDILKFDGNRIKSRFSEKDPYDTFDQIDGLHSELGIKPRYFVLCSKRGLHDKNILPTRQIFKTCLERLKPKNIGMHPSYQSNSDITQIKKEKNWLESASGTEVGASRQHFIRLSFPETYSALNNIGIKEDYSMGYPEVCGFRAGTSYPFKWYDIDQDQVSGLTVFPFQLLDVTLKKYLSLNHEDAIELSLKIIDEVKKHHGYCSVIWHNSSFFELETWKGWADVYYQILKHAKPE